MHIIQMNAFPCPAVAIDRSCVKVYETQRLRIGLLLKRSIKPADHIREITATVFRQILSNHAIGRRNTA